ncbi:MAG: hypothetical protein ACREN8_11225 [Candidatus Dormibacteraceae bacterium]
MGRVGKQLRRPFTWMVIAEVVLVTACLVASWRIWQDRQLVNSSPGMAIGFPSEHSNTPSHRRPDLPETSPVPTPESTPIPSSDIDSNLSWQLIQGMNSQEAAMESGQWQLVGAINQWLKQYFDKVLQPKIDKAESAGLQSR